MSFSRRPFAIETRVVPYMRNFEYVQSIVDET